MQHFSFFVFSTAHYRGAKGKCKAKKSWPFLWKGPWKGIPVLPLVFLGAVVDDPDAHLLAGQIEFLDADTVVGGADPGLRVQAQILGLPLLMTLLIHGDHLMGSMCRNRVPQTGKPLGNVPEITPPFPAEMRVFEKIPGKRAYLHPSIDFLPKRIYTNKIQHTHMEEPRNA